MKKITVFLIIFFFISGCANGPIRYKTLGHMKYGTYEFTKRSPWVVKPVAAVGGIATDATLVCLDTVAIPIVAVPITFSYGGPDGSGLFGSAGIVFFPFWYGLIAGALGVVPKKANERFFGSESKLFYEEELTEHESSDNIKDLK